MKPQKGHKLQTVLIVGRKNSGKSAYLEWMAQKAQQIGFQIGGFISKAEFEGETKARYFLLNLANNERRLLAWQSKDARSLHIGSYAFDRSTFDWGENFVQKQMDCDVLFFDEFGSLEIQGFGWHSLLERIFTQFNGILFISVRPSLLNDLLHLIKKKSHSIQKEALK